MSEVLGAILFVIAFCWKNNIVANIRQWYKKHQSYQTLSIKLVLHFCISYLNTFSIVLLFSIVVIINNIRFILLKFYFISESVLSITLLDDYTAVKRIFDKTLVEYTAIRCSNLIFKNNKNCYKVSLYA
jgi:hypothetical protein